MVTTAFDRLWIQIVLPADVCERVEQAFGGVAHGAEGPYRSVLLTGDAGCGKSALVRCIAKECGVPLIAPGFDWVWKEPAGGPNAGDTRPVHERNLADIFARARAQAPSILFFDETEVIFASPEATGANAFGAVRNSRTPELVSCLLAEIDRMSADGVRVLLVGATFERFGVDAAVRRRFDVEIELPFPDESARRRILGFALERFQSDQTVPEVAVPLTAGWSGRALEQLAREVCVAAANASRASEPDMWVEAIRSRESSG
jgi:ribosome biogenesis ATPase